MGNTYGYARKNGVGDRRDGYNGKTVQRAFNILLSAVTLSSLPQELDSVTVGAADRIRVSDCKVAFVIGADSGVFPLDPSTEGL